MQADKTVPQQSPQSRRDSLAALHQVLVTPNQGTERHLPIFGTFGDYPAPPDGLARCATRLAFFTAEQIEDVCQGPPQR